MQRSMERDEMFSSSPKKAHVVPCCQFAAKAFKFLFERGKKGGIDGGLHKLRHELSRFQNFFIKNFSSCLNVKRG